MCDCLYCFCVSWALCAPDTVGKMKKSTRASVKVNLPLLHCCNDILQKLVFCKVSRDSYTLEVSVKEFCKVTYISYLFKRLVLLKYLSYSLDGKYTPCIHE